MARVFAGLKLRLVLASLRHGGQRLVGFILGVLFGLLLAAFGFATLTRAPDSGETEAIVLGIYALLFVGWIILPLLSYSSDETLDPTKLALLPLRRRELMTGLLVSSCIGVAPTMTLLALVGALVGFGSLGLGGIVVAASILLQLAMCVAAARMTTTLLSSVMKSRRGRDTSIFVLSLLGASLGLLGQVPRLILDTEISPKTIDTLTGVLAGLPSALPAGALLDANSGNLLSAIWKLAGGAVVLIVLVWVWGMALERVLTTASSTESGRNVSGELFSGALRLLPRSAVGAVAVKDLLTLWRDPRRRAYASTFAFLLIGFVAAGTFTDIYQEPRAVLAASAVGIFSAFQSFNQYGFDGEALWMTLAATDDHRPDVTGRNVAMIILSFPLVGAFAGILAFASGGWGYFAPALAVGFCALLVGLAVANFVSTRFPYAIPEATTLWGTADTGQGCATGMMQFAGIIVLQLLLIPVAAIVIVGLSAWPPALVAVLVLGPLYGVMLWRPSIGLAASWMRIRQPELLAAVSPRS